MEAELNEEEKDNFEKVNIILACIFSLLNIFITLFSIFFFKSNTKIIRDLKYKLLGLIFIDSIYLIIYAYFKNEKSFFHELLFSALSSFEFYFFISFLYKIFHNTEMSILAKEVDLLNPLQIYFLFILVIFPYSKFNFIYCELLNCIQYTIIILFLIILYKYFKKTIMIISSQLISKDSANITIYSYLNKLNKLCLILILCYNIIKFISIFIYSEYYKIFLQIGLNTINQGLKYYIFLLFDVIIYNLSNKVYIINSDESVEIVKNNYK